MKIMVVGGGGREHAIIKKIKENKNVKNIYALPGNGGIALDAICVNIGAKETYATTEGWNQFKDIVEMDLTAIEDVLADGLSDADAVFYDLNGRVVEYPTNGIYIVNGKKVLVK